MSFLLLLSVVIPGCRNNPGDRNNEIIIFHAGSLSVPFKQLASEYQRRNPDIKILSESSGSLICARKVTELKKSCDIIASADYFVINELLIPEYAGWGIRFATNGIVIAFQDKSRYSEVIDSLNWFDILLRDDVTFARSDPDSDPCGYRSIFTFKLAEKYYRKPGLADKLQSKNRDFIRPKEVDLIGLVESNAVDYMFQYKSVALQHNLRYIDLPKDINLDDPDRNETYRSVSHDITGSSPGSRIKVTGEYISYSLTILRDAPNREMAEDFIIFLLGSEGMGIFENNGQQPIIPFFVEGPGNLPEKVDVILRSQKSEYLLHDQI